MIVETFEYAGRTVFHAVELLFLARARLVQLVFRRALLVMIHARPLELRERVAGAHETLGKYERHLGAIRREIGEARMREITDASDRTEDGNHVAR